MIKGSKHSESAEVNDNLLQKGYKILRFSEYDIKNNIEKIEKVLNENLS